MIKFYPIDYGDHKQKDMRAIIVDAPDSESENIFCQIKAFELGLIKVLQ